MEMSETVLNAFLMQFEEYVQRKLLDEIEAHEQAAGKLIRKQLVRHRHLLPYAEQQARREAIRKELYAKADAAREARKAAQHDLQESA